ncbi:MAG: phosphoribosylamine--glycine ligase [Bryobacteraceae bacterium]
MKILIIGSGGREHALAWRLAQSPSVEHVYAAPGNPGIARIGTCVPGSDYLAIADSVGAGLTVVGPEAPLVAGVVDAFRAAGKLIIGPDAAVARLEGSKVFAKNFFMQRNIPTAAYMTVCNPAEARAALDRFGFPVVLKADGLAAGKGVVVAHDRAAAETALAALKPPLVIEECLTGEEVSFIALSDGGNVLPLEPTQDHKAVYDHDTGPNTGGMGAYCDSRILTAGQTAFILDRVIRPTVEATGFTGFLYAGLMMTADGPKVLEFNVRLGDPETQPLMHRMKSDFAEVLLAAARGELRGARLEWEPGPSLCVVAASAGYPGAYEPGKPIAGIEDAEASGAVVFHAGTRMGDGGVETAGGRVLGITAGGATLPEAAEAAYAAVHKIQFAGMHYRTDIGRKGFPRWAS